MNRCDGVWNAKRIDAMNGWRHLHSTWCSTSSRFLLSASIADFTSTFIA